jgi:hypothetical protein
MKLTAARINEILTRVRAISFPRSFENAHDPSGQTIPGFSSKYLAHCPKYTKWTIPCSMKNTPKMNLMEKFLLSLENIKERSSLDIAWLALPGGRD